MTYSATRTRVEGYFDGTATQVWERLTSDAPVSRIRATVRAGRDRMRDLMLARLPDDLTGARVLDAGCGTGAMTEVLARRGADVVAVDLSAKLVGIAEQRLDACLRDRVTFCAGDMTDAALGLFDAVMAMDSLIYYTRPDLAVVLDGLSARAGRIVFTVAPRTPLLMAMWQVGKLAPRADRSPTMVPQSLRALQGATTATLTDLGRINSGFYISQAVEARA